MGAAFLTHVNKTLMLNVLVAKAMANSAKIIISCGSDKSELVY
jgi:hypothetical protein